MFMCLLVASKNSVSGSAESHGSSSLSCITCHPDAAPCLHLCPRVFSHGLCRLLPLLFCNYNVLRTTGPLGNLYVDDTQRDCKKMPAPHLLSHAMLRVPVSLCV